MRRQRIVDAPAGRVEVALAERLLREHKIDQLAVVDSAGKAVGLVDVQDLLDTRIG